MIDTKPEIGMGVTYGAGSDRYVGTIHAVAEDGKTFWFTDDHTINKAIFPDQDWRYIPRFEDDTAKMTMVSRVTRGKKKGLWTIGGKAAGTTVHLGVRNKHVDPSF